MRRYVIAGLAIGLLLWGFLAPPGREDRPQFGPWRDSNSVPELVLEVLSCVDRSPIAEARLALISPAGRIAEAVSDHQGLVKLPYFPVEDYLFRLRATCPGFENLDYQLRGDSLDRSGPGSVLMIPLEGRRQPRGSIRLTEGIVLPLEMICSWTFPGPGIRPTGGQQELRFNAGPEVHFELPLLPIGTEYRLDFGAAAQIGLTRGSAALCLRGRVDRENLELENLELRVRSVEGRVWDDRRRLCAAENLSLRLDDSPASPLIRSETDQWGRYAVLVPDQVLELSGRAILGSAQPRLVELPWRAKGERAEDLHSPSPIPDG